MTEKLNNKLLHKLNPLQFSYFSGTLWLIFSRKRRFMNTLCMPLRPKVPTKVLIKHVLRLSEIETRLRHLTNKKVSFIPKV